MNSGCAVKRSQNEFWLREFFCEFILTSRSQNRFWLQTFRVNQVPSKKNSRIQNSFWLREVRIDYGCRPIKSTKCHPNAQVLKCSIINAQQMLSLQDAYMLRCSLLKCCSNAPMLWCLVTLMVSYSNALFFYKCSSSHWCSNAQMLGC